MNKQELIKTINKVETTFNFDFLGIENGLLIFSTESDKIRKGKRRKEGAVKWQLANK